MDKELILSYLKELKPKLKSKGIKTVALFGSFANDNSNIYSDIDIAISKSENFFDNFGAYDYFDTINEIKSEIRAKFGRSVDILDLDSKSPFLKSIKKELIYV